MAAFEYTALDNRGREKRGVLEGDAARQIRQQLREQGLTPLSVEAVQQREARSKRALFRRGIGATDLALITRQLATLVRSGMPIDEALATVSKQTEKPRLKSMLAAVRSRVLEGHSLADALADFPHVFSDLFRSTVAAGEQSGHLEVVFERLADYTENRQHLSMQIKKAVIYPTILVLVALLVVGVLLAYVVPKVVQVFDNIGQELPLLTRVLIATSEFVQNYWLMILSAVLVLLVGFFYLLRYPAFRFAVHKIMLRLPLVSRLVRGLETARFARTFSILVASGVPVLDGMRISAQVMNNLPMREAVGAAAKKVREGSGIYLALESSGYFPPMTVNLIASGEAGGNLQEMLERAAAAQEREMESLISIALSLLEPLLLVSMALIVLFIVLAILLPIFDLNQLVK
ncbi:MAG TPA: type II secretion system protein GspF [Gammaproteobacteria bacterium]|nr:type II secretion system protein GspF [Gammaproteobacteria bacterium]